MAAIPDFEITTYDYSNPLYQDWVFPHNYHYLYILENGKDAYIGETNDIFQRSVRHRTKGDPCYPFHYSRIHVITGKLMERTPAEHFEKLLVKLMGIDGKFKVRNQDPGNRTFYSRKNEFELGFDKLWHKLVAAGLVRHRFFQSILNKTEYKYSPYTSLTEHQSQVLTNIVNAIAVSADQKQRNAGNTRPILIEGDAGTGKTVVASSLFHYLMTAPDFRWKKIGLVYANPSTREELISVFRCIPGRLHRHIIRPVDVTRQYYDILICDEAHRLRRNRNLGWYSRHFQAGNARLGYDDTHDELDWLRKNSACLVLLYDRQQIACPSDIPYEEFSRRLELEDCGIRPVALQEQLRIRA